MIIRVHIRKKIKLNLILTNPELFIIYWTCHHLFWFRFLKLLLIFYCQSSWQEISILKKQFLISLGVFKSNCKIKIRIFSSFMLIFNLRKLKKKINISLVNQVLNSFKEYNLVVLMFTWFSCVSLIIWNVLFEPAEDRRKTNSDWACVVMEVETKLSMQYIKNNLQQLKEIAVFII